MTHIIIYHAVKIGILAAALCILVRLVETIETQNELIKQIYREELK